MDLLSLLTTFNYGLVLVYGLFLSAHIAGGWQNRKQKRLIFVLCPLFLLLQILIWVVWGYDTTRALYPLITHLPLVLILIFILKKRVSVALVSVCTAYLCCQLPRWAKLAFAMLTRSSLAGEIIYTLSILLLYWLLRRYFVPAAHNAISYSFQNLFLFGSLPFIYYFFDYATVVYSNALHEGNPALMEFIPTALLVFYVGFIAAYHVQTQKRTELELQRSLLASELKQAGAELKSLRQVESQAAIYRHDLRHHLIAIEGFLSANATQQATVYIKQVQADVEAFTPKRFCENELVSLLCSSFSDRAERMGIRLTINAGVPEGLSIPDTELCSLLSNALENALQAADLVESAEKWVDFSCRFKSNKLLIEIKNPYTGKIVLRDGVPVSHQEGHGYGCRSIQNIAQRHRGLCSFETEGGVFTLRVVLPMQDVR